MRTLFFSLIFLPAVATAATMITGVLGKTPPTPPQEAVEFAIGFDHQLGLVTHRKKEWPVSIYCRWRNVSKKTQRILIKDHDDYHGTLDFPWGIRVRLTDNAGRCYTASESNPEGWFDCSVFMSQLSKVTPGDVIDLKPGESVIRRISVEDVVSGLPFMHATAKAPVVDGVIDMTKVDVPPFAYPPGRNKIEVKFMNVEARNSLTLLVGACSDAHEQGVP